MILIAKNNIVCSYCKLTELDRPLGQRYLEESILCGECLGTNRFIQKYKLHSLYNLGYKFENENCFGIKYYHNYSSYYDKFVVHEKVKDLLDQDDDDLLDYYSYSRLTIIKKKFKLLDIEYQKEKQILKEKELRKQIIKKYILILIPKYLDVKTDNISKKLLDIINFVLEIYKINEQISIMKNAIYLCMVINKCYINEIFERNYIKKLKDTEAYILEYCIQSNQNKKIINSKKLNKLQLSIYKKRVKVEIFLQF